MLCDPRPTHALRRVHCALDGRRPWFPQQRLQLTTASPESVLQRHDRQVPRFEHPIQPSFPRWRSHTLDVLKLSSELPVAVPAV